MADSDLSHIGISKWHVEPADLVKEGQPILEIMSDIYYGDVLSPISGVISEISFPAQRWIEGVSDFYDITLCRIDTRDNDPKVEAA